MRKVATPTETTELCSYGCAEVANFINGSNRLMCCKSSNSCPANKRKNSEGLKKCGRNYVETYKTIPQESKDKMVWNKGDRNADFSYGGRGQHKSALISERGYRCENCKLETWQGKPIPLELEHTNADRKDNTRENLKLLCPNCHAQTPTWRRGLGHTGWKKKKYSDEQMIETIKTSACLNQVLEKLDLRYGSAGTIIGIMSKYRVNFAGVM